MAVEVIDNRLLELVDPDVKVEQIATGFVFTEGPVWHSRDRTLTFSDVRTGIMRRWSEAEGAKEIRNPSNESNGNTYDADGNLLTCEHKGRRISRTRPDGTIEAVVESFQGARLNSPTT